VRVAYAEGKASDTTSLDLAACLDILLKPIARTGPWTEDQGLGAQPVLPGKDRP